MILSKATGYAIAAVAQLSDDPTRDPIPCRRLALCGDMPERFLLQILRALVMKKLLVSTRGVEGGYRLARPAAKISLLEIMEGVDGPLDGARDRNEGLDAASNRLIEQAVSAGMSDFRKRLAGINLASLKPAMRKQLAKAR